MRTRRLFLLVCFILFLGAARPVRSAIVLYYSFDGTIGADVPSGLVDDTGTYTAVIIPGSDPDSTIEYAPANPTFNTAGTSARFYNDNWLDNAGDTFLIPDSGGLDFSGFDEFTIELFVYPAFSGSGKTRRLFSEYVYAYMYLDADNTLHAIRKWGGGAWDENRTLVTMNDFPLDTWSHVAMTWDADALGDKFKLYVNGQLVGSAPGTSTATIDSTAGFAIGGYQRESGSRAQFFQGKIDEFRISDVALEPSEFLGGVASIAFETSASGAFEQVSPAELKVNLNNPEPGQTYTVDYAVTGGSAAGCGVDYYSPFTPCYPNDLETFADNWLWSGVPGRNSSDFYADGQVDFKDFSILASQWFADGSTLTFEPGRTSKTISFDIVDDGLDEEDETIIVTLFNPTGPNVQLGAITQHTYTIIDPRPHVWFDSPGSMAMENVTQADIPVSLSHSLNQTVTVDYAVIGGTATADIDYNLPAGTLTFDPCCTTETIHIDILNDVLVEAPETITLKLSNPVNAKLGPNTLHTFTIVDDEMSDTYTNSLGMEFVRIDPGTFTMGSENGDYDEKPVHTVTISQPFYMSKYEVTNVQYERFDRDHGAVDHRGFSHESDEAVIFVSWEDANAFCTALSQREGLPYRLPTEAEWEYACRAGTTTDYFTGDELSDAYYNQQNQTATSGPEPVPLYVGTALPNPWGLYDMHGNVEEWCYDWYGPYESGHQTDPIGRVKGHFRVSRGGSHGTYTYFLRSANRMGTIPQDKHWLIGFRPVIGQMPNTEPLPEVVQPYQIGVSQQIPPDINDGPPPTVPYFARRKYVWIPDGSNGPLFSHHNHVPGLVQCPNGDMIAAWYTCNAETPRNEHGIAISRLRYGSDRWDWASPFWDAPDRNDHTTTLWKDETGRIYHFQGLGAARWNTTATFYRTSTDNGVTWSEPNWVESQHTNYTHVESTIFRNSLGHILLSSDSGGGTRIRVSEDNGQTWYLRPGRLAGNHGIFAELADGRLLGFSRKNGIDGMMPQQISYDMGQSWTSPVASVFKEVGSGRRCVLIRLREGPLFLATFGTLGSTYLIGAVSYDDGASWPYKRLLTDCSGDPVETTDGEIFYMNCDTAEPRGYCAVWQAKNSLIHLITSRQHYEFNLKWLISR